MSVEQSNLDNSQDSFAQMSAARKFLTLALSLFYILIGFIIARTGTRHLKIVAPVFTMLFVVILLSALAEMKGLQESFTGELTIALIAIPLSFLAALGTFYYPTIGNRILGVEVGFSLGVITYIVIMAISSLQSVAGIFLVSILLALSGFILALYNEKAVQQMAIAFVSSYIIATSNAKLYGGVPSEREMWDMII